MTQQQLIERLAERTQTTKAEAKRNLEYNAPQKLDR